MDRLAADDIIDLLLPAIAGTMLYLVCSSFPVAGDDLATLEERSRALKDEVSRLEEEVARLERELEAAREDPWYVENRLRELIRRGIAIPRPVEDEETGETEP